MSKESKEPDYDEDKDQLEEKQEEETGEIKKKQQIKFFELVTVLQNISQYSTLYRKPRCIHISRTRKAQRF